jgi:tetratricopeptide (TPR) repeat protein
VNIFGNINHRAIGPMCRKILVDQVKGVEMHLAQGETHFALEQWAKAEPHLIRAYTDLKKDKKKNPSLKLLSMIGHLLYEQKKIDRSLAAYQEAINAHPNHAGIHNAVMLPLMAKKDFDKAIQVGQKAIQLDRGMVDAYYNLASAWIGKGDSDKASQILSAALQINPNFQKAKTLLKKIQGS